MMRPASLKNGRGLSVTAKIIFISAAVLMPGPECAPGVSGGAVFENFRFEGGEFSFSTERLQFTPGANAREGAFLPGFRASGFELRMERPAGDAAADICGFFSRASSSFSSLEMENGAVFFEAAPSFFPEEGISFEGLSLTPGNSSFLLEAESFSFGEFQVSGLRADIRSEGDGLAFPSVSGVFAGGKFYAEGRAGKDGSLEVSGRVDGLLIESLPGSPAGDVCGLAGLSFELSGSPGRPDSLSGKAVARFSDGDIRNIPVLRGLAPAFLGASYGNAVFDSGEASLVLEDGVVLLKNARLRCEEASISAAGSIMLDGRLDIIVEAAFTEDYMRRRSGPASILAYFLKICDYFIIRHRIAGTLAEPHYEPIPVPAITMLPLTAGRILSFLLPMRSEASP